MGNAGAPRAATIYDVARVAGVSHQTVSRYLSGFEGIRPATRERVETALNQLGYKPNLAARSLRTSKSHRIGALVHEMSERGPATITQGAASGAREAGYVLDIVSLDGFEESSIIEALDLLAEQNVAGIFATAQTDQMKAVLMNHRLAVPMHVETRRSSGSGTADSSVADSSATDSSVTAAAQRSIEHLLDLGHRRIAFVTGPMTWFATRDRLEGLHRGLAPWGLSPTWVTEGDWLPQSGFRAGMAMPVDRGITAVVAGNDDMALGLLRAFRERGLRVPEDVSVVGFDDISEAAFLTPALTTVRLDFEAEGRYAMRQLIAQIEGRPAPEDEPPGLTLIIRESTAPV